MFGGFADILVFAVVAIFVAVKLFSVLGRKDFSVQHNESRLKEAAKKKETLAQPHNNFPDDEKALLEKYGPALYKNITTIKNHHPQFTLAHFLHGAEKAFEIIVKSFNEQDKESLKMLLSPLLYEEFAAAIDKNAQQAIKSYTTLVAILSSEVKEIAIQGKEANITVTILSQQIHYSEDAKGEIIEGNKSEIHEIKDIWTFRKQLTSSDPTWQLVETQ